MSHCTWAPALLCLPAVPLSVLCDSHGKDCRLVDPTVEASRKYVWSLIESGYYQYGIKIFWLVRTTPQHQPPLQSEASRMESPPPNRTNAARTYDRMHQSRKASVLRHF